MLPPIGGSVAIRITVGVRTGAAAMRLPPERGDAAVAVGGTLDVAFGRSDAGRCPTWCVAGGDAAVVATGAAVLRGGGALVDVCG